MSPIIRGEYGIRLSKKAQIRFLNNLKLPENEEEQPLGGGRGGGGHLSLLFNLSCDLTLELSSSNEMKPPEEQGANPDEFPHIVGGYFISLR